MKEQLDQTQDDSAAVLAASRGDLAAYNGLVLKYQDLAYNHAFSMLGDRFAAEDAVQESFLRAYQNIPRFRGGSFRAWLLRIVTNLCLDQLRHFQRHPTFRLSSETDDDDALENSSWLLDPHPAVEAVVEGNEKIRSVGKALQKLPVDFRSVLVLIDVYGLDYAEAGQVLGIPMGTVKSRLARGRLQVQKSVQEAIFAAEVLPC